MPDGYDPDVDLLGPLLDSMRRHTPQWAYDTMLPPDWADDPDEDEEE